MLQNDFPMLAAYYPGAAPEMPHCDGNIDLKLVLREHA